MYKPIHCKVLLRMHVWLVADKHGTYILTWKDCIHADCVPWLCCIPLPWPLRMKGCTRRSVPFCCLCTCCMLGYACVCVSDTRVCLCMHVALQSVLVHACCVLAVCLCMCVQCKGFSQTSSNRGITYLSIVYKHIYSQTSSHKDMSLTCLWYTHPQTNKLTQE
jgi:hypothetical protein